MEAARTTLDIEVASDKMPERPALFDTIDLIGEEEGNLLVGFLPPDEPLDTNPFRFVSRATLSRQQWHWTGRTSGRQPDEDDDGQDTIADLRKISQAAWEATKTFLADAVDSKGIRAQGRAMLEPSYNSISQGTDVVFNAWRELIKGDGEWFAATSDADRFDQTGAWPLMAPPSSLYAGEPQARRGRGLILAKVPLGSRPQAQYWRFGAVAVSRYLAMMDREGPSNRGHGMVSVPWRRVVIGPGTFEEIPAPRLRLMIPMPDAVATATNKDDSPEGAWQSFLGVFDETWGDVGGLAEFIDAEVAFTTDTDETVKADTNALTAIFRPCYDIPEFGFDPILRASNALKESGRKLTPLEVDGCIKDGKGSLGPLGPLIRSAGVPLGLTFEETIGAVPLRSMVEVRLNVDQVNALAGSEGDRVFAEAYFRRSIKSWGALDEDHVESERTRLEWILFGASNAVWRVRFIPGDPLHWVHTAMLRFDPIEHVFHVAREDGTSRMPVNILATNATAPSQTTAPNAPTTTLVRRLAVILTYTTRGAGGDRRSEVFLGAGMVAEVDLDQNQTATRSIDKDPPQSFVIKPSHEIALRKPFFWFNESWKNKTEIKARLVELEFHKEHRDYRNRRIVKGRVCKDFFAEQTSEETEPPPDHPIFDAILMVSEDGGKRQDAVARICRISPPIGMLGRDLS